jgi:hypothetical protein
MSLTQYSSKVFSSGSNEIYYYKAIAVVADFNNIYTFSSNSSIQLHGYLYNGSFIQQSFKNLLTSDNDSDGDGQFQISYYLQILKRYILVVTTRYPNTTGSFAIFVTSPTTPADVSLTLFFV